eukprot:scaffold11018_cov112-Isochrysis_galbana.AAC.1
MGHFGWGTASGLNAGGAALCRQRWMAECRGGRHACKRDVCVCVSHGHRICCADSVEHEINQKIYSAKAKAL